MMTIHSAKGLEFGAVFIAGAEEGIFPSFRSTSDEDELQEERRLCYVAITRAKQKLFVTCARHRMLFGHTTANRPSRFLNEIPEECVVGLRENAKPKVEYSFSSDSGSSYSRPSQSSFAAKRPAPARNRFTAPAAPKKTANAAASFAKGDSIEHKAFGRGLVLSATPVGNDCLLEVAFDSVGTKRFMRNTAAQFMKKV
ncbi:MAG: ATP-binding domain-containing protein, partial [Oscillospiraceae bacterium]|nr:ATP-binding domain-containing protein [Oscillospiraceae bacterium]